MQFLSKIHKLACKKKQKVSREISKEFALNLQSINACTDRRSMNFYFNFFLFFFFFIYFSQLFYFHLK